MKTFYCMVVYKNGELNIHDIQFKNYFHILETIRETYCVENPILHKYILMDDIECVYLYLKDDTTGEKDMVNWFSNYDSSVSFSTPQYFDETADHKNLCEVSIVCRLCDGFHNAYEKLIENKDIQRILGKAEVMLRENYVMLHYKGIDVIEKENEFLQVFFDDSLNEYVRVNILDGNKNFHVHGELKSDPFLVMPVISLLWA